MRWADLMRLGVIALGALASIATSRLPEGVQLDGVAPLPGETGVSLDVQVRLELYVREHATSPDPRFVLVRQADGARLETTASWRDPYLTVAFEPLSAETDYVLVVEDPGWLADATWSDPLTGASVEGAPFATFELPFSTRLQPVVRTSWKSTRTSSTDPVVRTPLLVLSFSRGMDPDSFGPENVGASAGGQPVPVTIEYVENELHQLQLLAPTLDPLRPVTVTLGDGILAADGTALLAGDVMIP